MVITLEVLVEVVFRYVLQMPLAWGAEVSQTLLVWITFIGAALALYRGEHMVINLVVNKAPRRRRCAGPCWPWGTWPCSRFWCWGSGPGGRWSSGPGACRPPRSRSPPGILYLAFPFGCLLMIFVALRDFVRFWKE